VMLVRGAEPMEKRQRRILFPPFLIDFRLVSLSSHS
jgi:hypothetical protein